MIISHAHRFVFIKTRKTAGTSLEIARSRYCGARDVITAIDAEVAVDYVASFEDLEAAWRHICGVIGFPEGIERPYVKRSSRPRGQSYQDLIGPAEQAFIARACAR